MDEIPEKYRTDLAIIRETIEQIKRDLFPARIEINLSGNEHAAFDELKDQLRPFVSEAMKTDRHAFMALLYRVDISEKDYRKALSDPGPDVPGLLAELIIRREFQKALTRRFFSGKE